MALENIFFNVVDPDDGFAPVPDRPGYSVRILSDDMDAGARSGRRSRLLRLEPGFRSEGAHAHDYWEELYVLEGEMTIADGTDGEKQVTAPAYAIRAPGVMHGPVTTEQGCLMLDINWYD